MTGSQRVEFVGLKEELPKYGKHGYFVQHQLMVRKHVQLKVVLVKSFVDLVHNTRHNLAFISEKTFEYIDTPHKFKMGVSGCRSCVESGVKDLVLSQLKMDSKSISVVMVVQRVKSNF